MSRVERGFELLLAACDRLAVPVITLDPARVPAPELVLGQPLDPELRALYREFDGAWWSSPEFSLRVYPLEGPDALEWRNTSLRGASGDYVPPYPFDGLLAFAQYGNQASYLATVPSLADAAGRQPVLYLDKHEDPWAVPLASSVDGAFSLLARYLDRAAGDLGRAAIPETTFPLGVPQLIGVDAALSARVKKGEFKLWMRGDASIEDWKHRVFG